MATIKDIAEKTGLGLATISKYLNGGNVLEKNRIAIEQAIKELNFTVNEFARGLKTNRSKTIGVVIPQLNNVFMTSIITVIEEKLRSRGYAIMVCDSTKSEEREKEIIQFLMNKMVDGLIILPTANTCKGLELAFQKKVPVVLIDRMVENIEDKVDAVIVDNFKAAYDSTTYLINHGHKKIGLIIGPEDIYVPKKRKEGYEKALADNHIEVDKSLIICSDFTIQGGYNGMMKLLDNKEKVSAVFVTNYEMTLGCILALNDSNMEYPEEMSVIGFDNLQLAKALRPRLTIVTQPWEEIGKRAAMLLLKRMESEDKASIGVQTITLEANLEKGQSVARVEQ